MNPLINITFDLLSLVFTGLPLASQLSIAHTVFTHTYTTYRWLRPIKVKNDVSTTFISIQDVSDEDGEPMVLLTSYR